MGIQPVRNKKYLINNVIANGLVGFWKLDSASTLRDISGNGNTATVYGATITQGRIDKALQFDGVDDYVDAGNGASLNITDAITISAWVKWLSPAIKEIITKMDSANVNANAYEFYQGNNGVVFRIWKDGVVSSLSSATTITTNTWAQIVVTWDGTTKKIFINGVQDPNTQAVSAPIDSTTGKVVIGAYATAVYPFNGFIDEVRIYNRALSAAEIMSIFMGTG